MQADCEKREGVREILRRRGQREFGPGEKDAPVGNPCEACGIFGEDQPGDVFARFRLGDDRAVRRADVAARDRTEAEFAFLRATRHAAFRVGEILPIRRPCGELDSAFDGQGLRVCVERHRVETQVGSFLTNECERAAIRRNSDHAKTIRASHQQLIFRIAGRDRAANVQFVDFRRTHFYAKLRAGLRRLVHIHASVFIFLGILLLRESVEQRIEQAGMRGFEAGHDRFGIHPALFQIFIPNLEPRRIIERIQRVAIFCDEAGEIASGVCDQRGALFAEQRRVFRPALRRDRANHEHTPRIGQPRRHGFLFTGDAAECVPRNVDEPGAVAHDGVPAIRRPHDPLLRPASGDEQSERAECDGWKFLDKPAMKFDSDVHGIFLTVRFVRGARDQVGALFRPERQLFQCAFDLG